MIHHKSDNMYNPLIYTQYKALDKKGEPRRMKRYKSLVKAKSILVQTKGEKLVHNTLNVREIAIADVREREGRIIRPCLQFLLLSRYGSYETEALSSLGYDRSVGQR
jgi:hypothetical protein